MSERMQYECEWSARSQCSIAITQKYTLSTHVCSAMKLNRTHIITMHNIFQLNFKPSSIAVARRHHHHSYPASPYSFCCYCFSFGFFAFSIFFVLQTFYFFLFGLSLLLKIIVISIGYLPLLLLSASISFLMFSTINHIV